jgi:N6-L-threonylcarbamoyladenine synthase
MKILGLETSCDETAAAVVADGTKVLSSVVSSQVALHQPYGGVVPGLAAQSHLQEIIPVVAAALEEAHLTLTGVDALAVAVTPGLQIALLVGTETARALAYALHKPLVAINDLESHTFASFLGRELPSPAAKIWPLLALVVSGGTTALLLFPQGFGHFEVVGHTLDDTAGEAFDKVARLLGLGFPGGPVIEQVAVEGDPTGRLSKVFAIGYMKGLAECVEKHGKSD